MAIPNETNPGVLAPRARRTMRIAVLCVLVAAILFLAITSWLSGR